MAFIKYPARDDTADDFRTGQQDTHPVDPKGKTTKGDPNDYQTPDEPRVERPEQGNSNKEMDSGGRTHSGSKGGY
jgi:hypothetical protein